MEGSEIIDLIPEDSFFRLWWQSWPLSECPDSYIILSAMAMMGAALGRKVHFQLDVHRIYPLMNLLLIGPSGIGKSTSLRDMALDHLIRPLPDDLRPQVITGKSTKEALHDDLIAKSHAIVLASELANFFSKEKYQEGTIPYVTDLLDLAPASVRTKGGGLKTIQEPSVCFCGGSTKEWLQEQLPGTAIAGGFLPRFFIIKEDYKRQRVADPSRAMSRTARIQMEQDRAVAYSTFKFLVQDASGVMDFADYEASDEYSYWYNTYTPDVGILSPFAARAGVHVLRLAVLLAVSCGRREIRATDLRAAIRVFDYSMSKLAEVIVPMSAQGKLLMKVLEIIGSEMVSDVQVKRAMRNTCGSQDVSRLLQSLLESKDIVLIDGKYRKTGR